MDKLVVRTFEEKEYHAFFRGYIPDPMMDASPFSYNYEQISVPIGIIMAVSDLIMFTTVRFLIRYRSVRCN